MGPRYRLHLQRHADRRGTVDENAALADAVAGLDRDAPFIEIHAGPPVRRVTEMAWTSILDPLWADWLARNPREAQAHVASARMRHLGMGTTLAGLAAARLRGVFWEGPVRLCLSDEESMAAEHPYIGHTFDTFTQRVLERHLSRYGFLRQGSR